MRTNEERISAVRQRTVQIESLGGISKAGKSPASTRTGKHVAAKSKRRM